MQIRKASGEEMLALWGYTDLDAASPTARFFYQNIASGSAVFWALEHGGALIGELYVFFELEDKDFPTLWDAWNPCQVYVQYLGG